MKRAEFFVTSCGLLPTEPGAPTDPADFASAAGFKDGERVTLVTTEELEELLLEAAINATIKEIDNRHCKKCGVHAEKDSHRCLTCHADFCYACINGHACSSDEELLHYERTCMKCGAVWGGLHCPHDGYQNPCPKCKERPAPQTGDCECEFNY